MGYKVQIPCKGCGKMFTPCANCVNDNSAFHWRAIACSPECAKKYFKAVEEARSKNSKLEKSNDCIAKDELEKSVSVEEQRVEMITESESEDSEIPVTKKRKRTTRKSSVEENLERIE